MTLRIESTAAQVQAATQDSAERLLADQELKDRFYHTFLRPHGIRIPPGNLFWSQPQGYYEGQQSVARPGTAWRFNEFGFLTPVDADGVLRDYDPATGAFLGALAEPARENLVPWSNDLTQGDWVADGGTAEYVPTSEWGIGVTKFVADGGGATEGIRHTSHVFGPEQFTTRYIIVKAVGHDEVSIGSRTDNLGGFFVTFDLTTGELSGSSSASGFAAHIRNGWWLLRTTVDRDDEPITARSVNVSLLNPPAGAELYVLNVDCISGDAPFISSPIITTGSALIRPATTMLLPQLANRERGCIIWQGVMDFDPAADTTSGNQLQRFPFGRADAQQAINVTGPSRVRARNTTAANAEDLTVPEPLQGRLFRIAYFWDGHSDVFGVSCDGLHATRDNETVGTPSDDPIRFGYTDSGLEGRAWTDWICILPNVPDLDALDALTGELAP